MTPDHWYLDDQAGAAWLLLVVLALAGGLVAGLAWLGWRLWTLVG